MSKESSLVAALKGVKKRFSCSLLRTRETMEKKGPTQQIQTEGPQTHLRKRAFPALYSSNTRRCQHPVPGSGPWVGAHPQQRRSSSDSPMPNISFCLTLESFQHSLVTFCSSLSQYQPLATDRVWVWISAPGCPCKPVWICASFLMPGGNNSTEKCSGGVRCKQSTSPQGNVQSQGRFLATAASATVHQPCESQSTEQHGK